ncbi:hypothetical protein ACH4ZX_39635 [Streptomyces sp. NPDC020490]|uniref:hypothetical protein n=1 Tax=Streptomyces sp. NPDC020490 TaxID=3365078 RepID=UPI00378CC692
MPIEVWLLLPLALLLGLVCATVVCLVALSCADRTDIVAVTRELPDLVAIFLGTIAHRTWAAEDLIDWETAVVRMAWPGDDAVNEERWDAPADWRMREYLLRRLALADSHEATEDLLLCHCAEQIDPRIRNDED